MKEKVLTLTKSAQKVVDAYFNLPLGNKKVKCPYFRNRRHIKGGLRVMVGKGSPEEIVHEVQVLAKIRGVNLNKMSEEEIREFMQKLDIGIDCSGFAVHVLNAYLHDLGLPPVHKILTYEYTSIFAKLRRLLRPVENISAHILTSTMSCRPILDLNKVRPGDVIRVHEKRDTAFHVAVIYKVHKKGEKTTKIEYVHSHSKYGEENGVRKGIIEIIDEDKLLHEQKWIDDYKGRNYMKEDLDANISENFIKRFYILDKFYKEQSK